LHISQSQHPVETGSRRSVRALLLLVGDEIGRQPDRGEQLGLSQAAAAEPRVVHEHQMALGLNRRPLAADALLLRTTGHRSQLPDSLPQVGRIG
jgi:hypothetical protein